MARHVLPLVTLVLAGCLPDPPKTIAVDSRFTEEEIAILDEAVAEANRELGTELYGSEVLIYQGRFEDLDGFTIEDFDDGLHGIYVLSEDSPEYRWVANATDRGYGGYATLADVHMVYRYLPPPEATDEERTEMRRRFKEIALHELGHFLGMSHNPDPKTIMCTGDRCERPESYSIGDKRDFCFIYGCAYEPSD